MRGGCRMDRIELGDRVLRENFEKAGRKKKRDRIKEIILFSAMTVAVLSLLISLMYLFVFRVKSVSVEGSEIYSNDDIKDSVLARYQDASIFPLDSQNIAYQLKLTYPYIKNVKIGKIFPSALSLKIEDDNGAYYTEIAGRYFVLSHKLRLLECVERESDLDHRGLCHVTLPPVAYAVTGTEVVFKRKSDFENVSKVIETLYESDMSMLISSINMNDKFDMFFIYNHQYRIEFGKNENLDVKLELVRKIIKTFEDEFSTDKLKGTVNVSDITQGFVIFDSNVRLSGKK